MNSVLIDDFKLDFSENFNHVEENIVMKGQTGLKGNILNNIEMNQILPFYLKNKENLKCVNININSIRYKFAPLADVLSRSVIDILSVQESKLDDSFPDALFSVPGFKLHRKDHQSKSGGLLMLIRDDLPQQRRLDLESVQADSGRIELLAIEIIINREKWLMFNMYKQPQVKNNHIIETLESIINQGLNEVKNLMLFGDLNVNMLKPNNSLKAVFDILGIRNLVSTPTCNKGNESTLIDLLVTNVPKRIQNVTCIESELSDCNKMICWATKQKVPIKVNKVIKYRSYKHFNEQKFQQDLNDAPFHVSEIFENIDDSYWFCNRLIVNIIDNNAPQKTKKIKKSASALHE